ncbi:MAG: DUF2062 domain-containing protein [Desulfobacteraceae bacterium]|nr:MAG: DUF2062 domain-containing protein [Desulfobacteraceae bacterium]
MVLKRRIKYYYLKILRLRGNPRDLAVGIAVGVFAGSMPILPFQSAFAIALALAFRASKITALLGTWISNPLNWHFLYYYSYKIGACILGLNEKGKTFKAIMEVLSNGGGDAVRAAEIILDAGGWILAAFLTGGLVLAAVTAPFSYFLSLYLFRRVKMWRESRKKRGMGCFLFSRRSV